MLDFIAEVSLYIKVAKDTQMEELLLLLSMLVRKAANPKAMQYLDEAWKESMQRTAGVKAIVVANALDMRACILRLPAELCLRYFTLGRVCCQFPFVIV